MESENSKAPKTGHANDSDRLLCFAFTSTIASVDSTQMVDMRIEGCATYAAAVAIDRGPVPLDQSRIGISLLSCLLIAIVGGGGSGPAGAPPPHTQLEIPPHGCIGDLGNGCAPHCHLGGSRPTGAPPSHTRGMLWT
jgi:hypothetical protein